MPLKKYHQNVLPPTYRRKLCVDLEQGMLSLCKLLQEEVVPLLQIALMRRAYPRLTSLAHSSGELLPENSM